MAQEVETQGAPPGQTAARPAAEWHAVEMAPEFRELVSAKRRLVLPATVFFILYYFALPVLVGYFPEAMSRDVIGEINLAYLFALSQFFMAWGLAYIYTRKAAEWDKSAAAIIHNH